MFTSSFPSPHLLQITISNVLLLSMQWIWSRFTKTNRFAHLAALNLPLHFPAPPFAFPFSCCMHPEVSISLPAKIPKYGPRTCQGHNSLSLQASQSHLSSSGICKPSVYPPLARPDLTCVFRAHLLEQAPSKVQEEKWCSVFRVDCPPGLNTGEVTFGVFIFGVSFLRKALRCWTGSREGQGSR